MIKVLLGTDHLTCRGGGDYYGYLFRSEVFFRTTRELEYSFIMSPEFNIRLHGKNSESN